MKKAVVRHVARERASQGLALINEALSLLHDQHDIDAVIRDVRRVLGWHAGVPETQPESVIYLEEAGE